MGQVSLINGLQYAGYALELSLLVMLLSRKRIRRFPALCAYVAALFAVDVGRGWVLRHYGASSPHHVYYLTYWLTDLLLQLGVYVLVCTFFRRACRDQQKVWEFIRPILTMVFLLVMLVSAVALGTHFGNLFTRYIYEFEQDLYFVCLVLNTILYVMIQRFRGQGDLHLLVTGLGVQLAGLAASSAFASLNGNHEASRVIMTYLSPVCFLAMMVIWLYAIAYSPSDENKKGQRNRPRRASLAPSITLKPAPAGQHNKIASIPHAFQGSLL